MKIKTKPKRKLRPLSVEMQQKPIQPCVPSPPAHLAGSFINQNYNKERNELKLNEKKSELKVRYVKRVSL